MKSAASTRHARVLEDVAAPACVDESAPARTWLAGAGGWVSGGRVRAGGWTWARGWGEVGETEGRKEAAVSRGARTPQPRASDRVERTSSWPLKQKPGLPKFPLPRWTHRKQRWSRQSRPGPSPSALSGCHSFTGPLCSLRADPSGSAAQRSAPAHPVKRSGPVVKHRPSAAAWMLRGGGGDGALSTASIAVACVAAESAPAAAAMRPPWSAGFHPGVVLLTILSGR